MKYQSSNSKQLYEVSFDERKYRLFCPECHKSRTKNKTDKSLEYYPDTKTAYCFHCNTTLFEYKPYHTEKTYIVPEWNNKTELTDGAVKYFEGRMISQKTLLEMGIYSGCEFMPQTQKEEGVICFRYFKDEKVVNIKYRTKDKKFKLHSGSELIFYNHDQIFKADELIIVEGEIDALTFIENGYKNVVSVPNGANKNLSYMDDIIFTQVKIYLACDQDTKGIELRDELARRLGHERCNIVSFKECKDANEYFCKYGGPEFKNLLTNSIPYPIDGIIFAENIYQDIVSLYENGIQRGQVLQMSEIDKFITWEAGRLAIVTGIPGSGKSEFVDYIVSKLNLLYGWKVAYFTPENYPLKFHYAKMFEKLIGKPFRKVSSTDIEFDMAFEYLKDNVFYILPELDFTVKTIIDKAKQLVKSKGIKILVLDPYNKLEHKYTDSETQYISRFLDEITTFSKLNNILLFLIAHPKKMNKDASGQCSVPSLYDISGSANFYNKCDYGFTVHRKTDGNGVMQNKIEVHWQKIKFKHLGSQGISDLNYNYINGRFEPDEQWDNSNWLIKNENIQDTTWEELTNKINNEIPF